jgi:hypothetical protein
MNPRFILTLGVTLMFLGVVLPFLMVVRVLQPTFALIFISSGISTLGLALGMTGFSYWVRNARPKK